MSDMDANIIALGRIGDPEAGKVISCLVDHLDQDAAFSHCRAVALAAASLRSRDLSIALERLITLPGFRGHAVQQLADLFAEAGDDTTTTRPRTLASGSFMSQEDSI